MLSLGPSVSSSMRGDDCTHFMGLLRGFSQGMSPRSWHSAWDVVIAQLMLLQIFTFTASAQGGHGTRYFT